ncbi:MAG TPA: hypothetical protein VKD90_14135 [Gemmataceae bacterium]|nr:hypothetical protein [Gemmataceae bacterium]
MPLEELLFKVTRHYRERCFSERAIRHLRWVLIAHSRDGQLDLKTAFSTCNRRIKDILANFGDCGSVESTPDLRRSAQAVFGFAFGYRMDHWPTEDSPTDPRAVAAHRRPGRNNIKLARIAKQTWEQHRLPLYLQFEIADAISPSSPVEFRSPRLDLGTAPVLATFLDHARLTGKSINRVVVVCHRHHYERCRLILDRDGITAIPPHRWYSGYDRDEAQPRVMSPDECIVNDFASMAAMRRPAARQ